MLLVLHSFFRVIAIIAINMLLSDDDKKKILRIDRDGEEKTRTTTNNDKRQQRQNRCKVLHMLQFAYHTLARLHAPHHTALFI